MRLSSLTSSVSSATAVSWLLSPHAYHQVFRYEKVAFCSNTHWWRAPSLEHFHMILAESAPSTAQCSAGPLLQESAAHTAFSLLVLPLAPNNPEKLHLVTLRVSTANTEEKEVRYNTGKRVSESNIAAATSWWREQLMIHLSGVMKEAHVAENVHGQTGKALQPHPRRQILILTWKNCLSHNYYLETPGLSTNHTFTLFPF